LDHKFGRVLKSLHRLGYAEHTVVIFSSDQGLAVGGRHGLMGKQNLYEHVKPPLVLSGPGIPHGQSDALVYLYDLFPTICSLTGATIPHEVEGKDLTAVLRDQAEATRPYLFAAYRECQRMVRDKRWKLMEYVVGDQRYTQLFDLATDPDELDNLAERQENADQLATLRRQLHQLGKEFGDPVSDFYANPLPSDAARSAVPTGR
jgi:arylsulfatase A-like enzyme